MTVRNILILMVLMMIAVPTFAQTGSTTGTFVLPGAFAMAIASGLCALAQGKAISASVEGIARNPGAAGAIRILLILGLAFIESLALFTLINVGK
ncbi:MAG: ATP synthase F0 subunit C [Acidobacteria bacterium]|jgi:F-type H+-transporting ATPase subunit c|uniref:ATP synthase F(0) sector subunit c n=1 Tax=Paludibaculum fermentans TaxID=1473598 RepID=A0A7S7NQ73_PALFE|nr:ATP synthase F0 subunit C [Paludibaculum fermentans]MBN9660587.1 ATP synthase F0 subunit C [Acidobacteriota bacterium]QOY87785.1 ATP synthase F0 subunit C [Paludibaculum fermentans]